MPMIEKVVVSVNGCSVAVERGNTVATAVYLAGVQAFRHSVTGELRAPLCGMGICMECRVTIDGEAHRKSCQVVARDGMRVVTS